MSNPRASLRNLFDEYSDDHIMLDAIYIWSQNPTSKSAGHGVDENYEYISTILKTRYNSGLTEETLQNRDVREIVENLRREMGEITEAYKQSHSEPIYKARSDIEELYEELELASEFRSIVESRIQRLDKKGQEACLLLSELLKRYFRSGSKKVAQRLKEWYLKDFNHYFQALFEQSPPNNNLFVEIGLLNRLLWISSGSSGKEIEYLLPEYLQQLVLDMEDYVEVSIDSPDLKSYLDTLFESGQIASFEQLLFKENGCSKNTNLDLPLNGRVVYAHSEYYVISPFIERELRDEYKDYRTENLEENSKVQSVLTDLRDALHVLDERYKPRSELKDFQLNSETVSYQARIVLENNRVEVVLTDFLSELTRQRDFEPDTLLVLVDQRIPEAERQLKQIGENINGILIYGNEIYGLTSLKDSIREIIDELAVRDYDLKEVEIENISSTSTSRQSFHEIMDQHVESELWSSAVQRGGAQIEDLMHQIYLENSTLPDPDQHKQAIEKIGPMDGYGLGQWIGYFRMTNLFQELDSTYELERQYFRSGKLNRINDLYNEVKHPPRKEPSSTEAREIATLAKNIIDETKPYTEE